MDATVGLALGIGGAGILTALLGRWRRRMDLVIAGLAAVVVPYALLNRAPGWVTVLVASVLLLLPWMGLVWRVCTTRSQPEER